MWNAFCKDKLLAIFDSLELFMTNLQGKCKASSTLATIVAVPSDNFLQFTLYSRCFRRLPSPGTATIVDNSRQRGRSFKAEKPQSAMCKTVLTRSPYRYSIIDS